MLQAIAKACLASGRLILKAGAFQVGKITFGKLREIESASGSTAASEAEATATEGPAEESADEKAHITEAPGKAAEVQHSLPHQGTQRTLLEIPHLCRSEPAAAHCATLLVPIWAAGVTMP